MKFKYLPLFLLLFTHFSLHGASDKDPDFDDILWEYYANFPSQTTPECKFFTNDFERLFDACKKNNVAVMKKVIQRYLNTPGLLNRLLNAKKRGYHLRPLTIAAINQHLFAVQILLAAGANPNFQSDIDEEPPLFALFRYPIQDSKEAADLFNAFFIAGADLLYIDHRTYKTLLHEAARQKALYSVQILLETGIDPNISDIWDNTPLHVLFEKKERIFAKKIDNQKEFLAILDTLLAAGANPFLKSRSSKKNIFELALERYDLEACKLLYNYTQHYNDTKIFLHRFYTYLNSGKSDHIYTFHAQLYRFMQSIADKDKESLIQDLKEFMQAHSDDAYPDYQEIINTFLHIPYEEEQNKIAEIKEMYKVESERLKHFIANYPSEYSPF